MGRLRILLLGPPRIVRDEKPLILKRRKALALLSYLAVSRRPHSREVLAALLWPDARPARAYANLRNLLWILRENGISDWLDAGHDTVELRPDSRFWLDVSEFEERLRRSRRNGSGRPGARPENARDLAQAVELYGDHFMAGFGLGDSAAFDEWQAGQQETLQAGLAEALEKLVRHHRDRNRFDKAIAYARRRLALDPLCEPVQRELMSLYADAGRRGSALELFETSARLLGEIGLSPVPETVRLRDRILGTRPISGSAGPWPESPGSSPKHNLPARLTPFLGRAREMAEIRLRLADPGCRLLTLSGPGGCGKTRLAVEAAAEPMADFPDGIFFVPLAAVEAPESLVPAVIDVLRAPLSRRPAEEVRQGPRRGSPLRARLLNHLRRKTILLILDNMEHLLAASDEINVILREAPGVKILATTRERLRLPGEWVMEIEGLTFPGEGTGAGDEFPSVRLFVESARRADSRFAPTGADLSAAARICSLVEGNPLGIQIASGWVPAIPTTEIAARIEAGLDFLASRSREVLERHRSLRAVFEHSWGLLPEGERRAFSRLAVFRGAFSREAALEVMGESVTTLSALVEKSLVRQNPADLYQIHEVLRPYIGEKLKADPSEHTEALDRLCRYYLRRLESLESAIKGSMQDAALEALAREGDHIRVAWLRAAERGWTDLMAAAALSLFLFHDIRSRTREGAEVFGQAYEILRRTAPPTGKPADSREILRGLCAACYGWFLRFTSPSESRAFVRRGVDLAVPRDDGAQAAFVRILATITGVWPSREVAGEELARSLAAYETNGDRWGAALVLEILAFGLAHRDAAAALRAARESLRLRRSLGDRWGVALALYALGWIAEVRGFPRAARKRYRESLLLRQQIGQDIDGVIDCYNNLGRLARRTGDYREASEMFEKCLALSREISNPLRTAHALTQIGIVAWDLGECDRARAYLEEAQPLVDLINDPRWATILLRLLGNMAASAGDWEEARFLLDASSTDVETDSASSDPADLGPRSVFHLPWLLLGRGRLAVSEGDATTAGELFGRAFRLCMARRDHPTALEALLGIAELRVRERKHVEAAELLAFIAGHPAAGPVRRDRARKMAEPLSPERSSAVRRAAARGTKLTLDELARRFGDPSGAN